jgi:hypothetical protein
MACHIGALGLPQGQARRHSGAGRCFIEAVVVGRRARLVRRPPHGLPTWPMISRQVAPGSGHADQGETTARRRWAPETLEALTRRRAWARGASNGMCAKYGDNRNTAKPAH